MKEIKSLMSKLIYYVGRQRRKDVSSSQTDP